MTREEFIEKGKMIYAQTMQNVKEGGDPRILVVTDQSKAVCNRSLNKPYEKKACREGVTEAMEKDLRLEFAKKKLWKK